MGALTLVLGFAVVTAGGASADGSDVCAGLDSGKIDLNNEALTVTITAPDGFLIDAYCVKAASDNNGGGARYVTVDPPQASVTISYVLDGKAIAISHYSYSLVPVPTETPTETVTETPTETPTETVTETPTETVTETPTETVTVSPTETETPTDTGSPTVTVLPTESESPTGSSSPTDSVTVLPTEVDAGTPGSGSGSSSNGWALMGSGLALLMLSAGLMAARRPRGTHGF